MHRLIHQPHTPDTHPSQFLTSTIMKIQSTPFPHLHPTHPHMHPSPTHLCPRLPLPLAALHREALPVNHHSSQPCRRQW